ncbi:hypothetical protein TeGR_g12408 [Tetraparma gracilis]|uniref:Protein kinase domain-containing protein n=1 Tax=Tetraparma gracilis TaxID=2962635 RepID=A0ABQ6M9H3_9STRA|nr:hypothetical protein TeGR_g12408 [Tetraparma gracilis]
MLLLDWDVCTVFVVDSKRQYAITPYVRAPIPGRDFDIDVSSDATPLVKQVTEAMTLMALDGCQGWANLIMLFIFVFYAMKQSNLWRDFSDLVAFSLSWNDHFYRYDTYEKLPGPDDAYSRNFKVVKTLLTQHHSELHQKLQNPLDSSKLELLAVIGKGTNATVSLARYHNNIVAVKELDLSRSNLPDMIAFVAEMELMANLQHPNIIRFERLCFEFPKLCMIMEYAKSGSLRSVLQKSPLLDWRGAKRRFAIGVAEGMQYMHGLEKPVLHRDLKTANVLLTEWGGVKISDFGESKLLVGMDQENDDDDATNAKPLYEVAEDGWVASKRQRSSTTPEDELEIRKSLDLIDTMLAQYEASTGGFRAMDPDSKTTFGADLKDNDIECI